MNVQNQINFLSGKIQELGTAILTYQDSNLLKFPSAIVEASYVDEVGCVWLAISKPVQHISEFDKSFHVALNFYKKGKPFFLNAFGTARVVLDPEELNHVQPVLKTAAAMGKVLISVRILEAAYHETAQKSEENFLHKCFQTIHSIFMGSNEYAYFRFTDNQNFA